MAEPQSFFDLEHKLLNEHHGHYVAFTRLVLSLTVGSFALLAALRDTLVSGSKHLLLVHSAYPLLLVSILAGVFVQHRIMMNPIWHLESAKRQAHEWNASGDMSLLELRRRPSKLERWFYRFQVGSLIAAFMALAIYAFQSREMLPR